MYRCLSILFFVFIALTFGQAQTDDTCNALGVWLWRFENTGQPSHSNLARTLSSMGAKRIYVKVADGGYDPDSWPTIQDEDLVADYLEVGVSPWAWSYNYQGNYENQAKALYQAAKTGYQGFVIDIEIEFNGESQELESLMQAFFIEKQRAISDGYADQDFALYVTTWGNPATHNYRIDIIDKYVDGYMPQTYIEEWQGDHLTMIDNCIEESKLEYESLGATKPLHNIVSTAQQILTEEEISHFFRLSGPEASVWRVPGGGVSQTVWDRWQEVDWEYNFCNPVSVQSGDLDIVSAVYPNPVLDILNVRSDYNAPVEKYVIYHQDGRVVGQYPYVENLIDVSHLPSGLYYLTMFRSDSLVQHKFVKL